MRAVSQTRRKHQGGYALLMIFLMAAIVAIMLYQQLPRVAFESERVREQLLIDRGEQYQRAIELFVKDNNAFPQSIDDLEDTNNKRYLRRRYIDPFTGKDEWRLVHTNGQQLTDSLVEAPPDIEGDGDSPNSAQNFGQPGGQQPGGDVNRAVQLRPSDQTLPDGQSFAQGQNLAQGQNGAQAFNGAQGFNGSQGQNGNQGQNGAPGQPGQQNPATGGIQANGTFVPQFPGQQFPGQPPPPGVQLNGANPNQDPNQQANQNPPPGGFVPQFPGQQFPGQPPPPGVQVNNQNPNQAAPAQFPGQQFNNLQLQNGQNGQQNAQQSGQGQPQQLLNQLAGQSVTQSEAAAAGLQGANPAVGLINQILTNPRPQPGAAANQNGLGGGIAGVASTYEGPSIKLYNDRERYEEWEFIYTPQTGAGGLPGQPPPNGDRSGGDGQPPPVGGRP